MLLLSQSCWRMRFPSHIIPFDAVGCNKNPKKSWCLWSVRTALTTVSYHRDFALNPWKIRTILPWYPRISVSHFIFYLWILRWSKKLRNISHLQRDPRATLIWMPFIPTAFRDSLKHTQAGDIQKPHCRKREKSKKRPWSSCRVARLQKLQGILASPASILLVQGMFLNYSTGRDGLKGKNAMKTPQSWGLSGICIKDYRL